MIFKKSLAIVLFYFFIFFLSGCSSHLHKVETTLPRNQPYAISAFWNYTETPMAGLRAASIVEGVLASHKIPLLSQIEGSEEMGEPIKKRDFLNAQKQQARDAQVLYLVTGEVQEWRYKTGIDGEPVVSYSMEITRLSDDQVLFRGVGAKSGWGHKSIGVVAQEIAQELMPHFAP